MTSAKFLRTGRVENAVLRRLSGLCPLLVLALPLGCSPAGDPPAPQAVFIDGVTKQVVVTTASAPFPAIHPETGQATLMPAMHCPRCVAWRQVPPPDQLNQAGRALACGKCKQPLQLEGPLPDELASKLSVTQP